MEIPVIREKLRQVPPLPGVYMLRDETGKIIYVGKAKALRNRLRSHFKPGSGEDFRHHRMMSRVQDFEWIVTDSEVEALILEANYVKEHRPRYNVNLKDDKSFPYIRLTHEPYPRVFITRKIVRDGSKYFGPYTDVGTLRMLMAAIRRIFPIRNCGLAITAESISLRKHRVCLMYHIRRCGGPCEGHVSEQDYAEQVGRVVAFIQGRDDQLLPELEKKMREMAAHQRFEEAADIRDQIRGLSLFRSRQKVAELDAEDRDIFAVAEEGPDACGVAFNARNGKIINRSHYFLENAGNRPLSEVLSSLVEQYYLRTDFIPGQVFLSEPVPDAPQISAWLSRKAERKVVIHVPSRGKKAGLMAMAVQNANLLLKELLAQREQGGRASASVSCLQKDLGLEHPPMRIEAFDISNSQGSEPVASLVVFENGKPKKSDYRKFKIRTVQGIDDFAMMAEVVERRLSGLMKEKAAMPDLLLVDGGKGQLSAAKEVLDRLGLSSQPVIGLAKRLEEVFKPGLPDPQTIPRSSPGLRLLQQVRDEAHRFAVTFHRSLRSKRTLHSALDDITGVGEKRRNALLKAFGSVGGIRSASVEALSRVPGMNRKAAERVKQALSQSQM